MLHSILRSSFVAAFAVALVGCGDGSPVSPDPIEEPEVVFTASVLSKVDGTVNDASVRIMTGVADAAFAAQLTANLEELASLVAAQDLPRAGLTLQRTRAMLDRTDVSQEVLDAAHDLSAVELILDQTEILIDRAMARS
jgi:hypothetical protein